MNIIQRKSAEWMQCASGSKYWITWNHILSERGRVEEGKKAIEYHCHLESLKGIRLVTWPINSKFPPSICAWLCFHAISMDSTSNLWFIITVFKSGNSILSMSGAKKIKPNSILFYFCVWFNFLLIRPYKLKISFFHRIHLEALTKTTND